MANKARLNSFEGELVRALDACSLDNVFYCKNTGCHARMHLCKEGTSSPYFASYDRSEHKYTFCLDRFLTFNPDKYVESEFNLENAINRICHLQDNDIHNKKSHHNNNSNNTIGSNSKIGIKTAKQLYSLCDYVGCGKMYNGIPIDSFYLCAQNKDNFITALDGFCIVKAKYVQKIINESIIKFEFETSTKTLSLGVYFDNEWEYYNQISKNESFKKFSYVIEAVWEISDSDDEFDYICHINKLSQIFYLMND